MIFRKKVEEIMNQSPNSTFKRKLILLNETWASLLSAAKEHQQTLDKVKNLLDELIKVEGMIRKELDGSREQIEQSKASKGVF